MRFADCSEMVSAHSSIRLKYDLIKPVVDYSQEGLHHRIPVKDLAKLQSIVQKQSLPESLL